MFKAESRLVRLIKDHFDILLMIIALAAGLLIRIPLLSAYAIPQGSGGNLFHVLGDLLPAFFSMFFIRKTTGDKNRAVAVFVLFLILPSVFVSSVMCGRLENLSFAFWLLSFALLEKKDSRKAMIVYALACAASIYALLLLPFIFMTYGNDKKFNKLYFLIPAVPAVVRGILDSSYIPAGIINTHLFENCGSFFTFLNGNGTKSFGRYLPLCFVLLFFMLYLLLRYNEKIFSYGSLRDRLLTALISTEALALLVPGADLGSTAFGAMLALCLAVVDIRFIPAAVVLGYLRLIPMTGYLYGAEYMPFSLQGQTWLRIAALIAVYIFAYHKRDKKHVL
ncbi:MAG: hypothetical protein K6B44_07590 [Lachnospiraceae bacterium]|nr:hypothetical protein [Lachnospiraceae bacterium]